MLKHRACRRIYVDTLGTVGALSSVATISTVGSCNYLIFHGAKAPNGPGPPHY